MRQGTVTLVHSTCRYIRNDFQQETVSLLIKHSYARDSYNVLINIYQYLNFGPSQLHSFYSKYKCKRQLKNVVKLINSGSRTPRES